MYNHRDTNKDCGRYCALFSILNSTEKKPKNTNCGTYLKCQACVIFLKIKIKMKLFFVSFVEHLKLSPYRTVSKLQIFGRVYYYA